MSNTKKCNFGCYLKNLFKLRNLLPTLLLTALAVTAIALNYEFHIFRQFFDRKKLFTVIIVAVSLVCAVGLGYFIASVKNKKIVFADHVCFAMVLTAIALLIYNLVKFKTVNVRPLFVIIAALIIGIAFIILHAKYFDENAVSSEIAYTKNCMSGYFATVFAKYSFISIVLTAILTVCGLYLVLNPTFRISVRPVFEQHPALLYVLYIAIGLTALYLGTSAFSKKIVPSDVLFLSSIISLPISLTQILVLYPKAEGSLLAWAILTALVLIFGIVRFLRFDVTVTTDKPSNGSYFKQLFAKYNFLFVLSLSSIIVSIVAVTYKARLLQNSFNFKNGTFNPQLKFIILSIVGIAIIAFGIYAFVTSVLNLKSERVTVGDLMLSVLTVTALFALSFFAFSHVTWILVCIVCGLAACLILLVARLVYFIIATHK